MRLLRPSITRTQRTCWCFTCHCNGEGGSRTIDAYGQALDNALLPGAGWIIQHDHIHAVVSATAKRYGVVLRDEPEYLFAGAVPASELIGGARGIVPDLIVEC